MSMVSESNAVYSSLVYLQFVPDQCPCNTSNPLLILQPPFPISHYHQTGHSRNSCSPRLTPFLLSLHSSSCAYPLLMALFFFPLLILCIPKQTLQVIWPLKRNLRTWAMAYLFHPAADSLLAHKYTHFDLYILDSGLKLKSRAGLPCPDREP